MVFTQSSSREEAAVTPLCFRVDAPPRSNSVRVPLAAATAAPAAVAVAPILMKSRREIFSMLTLPSKSTNR